MAADWIKPGGLLAGRYRIETVLGEGGMGIVVAATHVQLGKKVAVKILRPQLASDEEQSARFSREAQAGVRLTGEHSVHVLDVGALADGTPYMVMEFLVGADLGAVLSQRKKLMPFDAVDYVLQAAEGIGEAHAHGIIHRDVKPQNLFLTHRADGSPLIKVLDFGLNKGIDNDKTLTKSRTIFGSPYYMSPEQMKASRDVDARTDIWALGTCLYELLVGEPPFEAPTVAELMIKVLQERPEPPHVRAPAVDPGLSEVVLRCLEKNADARFPGIRELAAALEPFASPRSAGAAARIANIFQTVQPGAPVMATTFLRQSDGSADPMTRTEASWDSAARRETRKKQGLVVGVTGVVVLGLGIGAMTLMERAASKPEAAPTTNAAGALPVAAQAPPPTVEALPPTTGVTDSHPPVGASDPSVATARESLDASAAPPPSARTKARPPVLRAKPAPASNAAAPVPPAPSSSKDPDDTP
jgi:serine/threonine protein kinase